jgi:hypothetical protein
VPWISRRTIKAPRGVLQQVRRVAREGAECVYRHTPGTILCVFCADSQKIRYRPSMRWERRNRKRKAPSPRKA